LKVQPVSGGWFKHQSNLGNINFDVSDDGVVAGNWSTFRDGKAIWYYFQGRMEYAAPEQTLEDGVIATADAALAEVVRGSPCLDCDFQAPEFSENGRIRLEFTSTRTARFIHNDAEPTEISAWMQGNPLVEQRDYSGEWVVTVNRRPREGDSNPDPDTTIQTAVVVRLEPIVDPVVDVELMPYDGSDPSRPLPLELDARRYQWACASPQSSCDVLDREVFRLTTPCIGLCLGPYRHRMMLFFNADESGELIAMDDYFFAYEFDRRITFDDSQRIWKAYGSRDKVIVRYSGVAERPEYPRGEYGEPTSFALDIEMHRLPTGFFNIAGSAP
jgi:hypothetical protein